MIATTALRKISALRKRIRCIQGGQGAGKTYSIIEIISNHCSSVPNREVFILSGELTKMRITVIKDFIKILIAFGIYNERNWSSNGTLYRFQNGSFVKFIGADKEDIGKGLRGHVLYINEADKVPWETARQAMSRIKNIYIDYNPDAYFWAHEHIMNRVDCDFLKLTYLDNECCPKEEVSEILLYKEKGYYPDGTIKNKYWANKWQVYGLGNVGVVDGAIFENWETFKNYPETSNYTRLFGIDWGSSDPTVFAEHRFYPNMEVYSKCHYYMPTKDYSGLKSLIKRTMLPGDIMIADSAKPDLITDMLISGINCIPCDKRSLTSKGSILDGIDIMQNYYFYVHESDENAINELKNYARKKDKYTGLSIPEPIDKFNHFIDELRYCVRAHHLYGY